MKFKVGQRVIVTADNSVLEYYGCEHEQGFISTIAETDFEPGEDIERVYRLKNSNWYSESFLKHYTPIKVRRIKCNQNSN